MSSISILEIPLYVTLSKLIIDPKHNVESNDHLCDEGRHSVRDAEIYFCGVQAQHLSALKTLSEIGIRNVTVPPNDYHLEGLPMALRITLGAKEIIGDQAILEQQYRMARRAEYS